MLSVRSRSFVNGEVLARLSRPMMIGSVRNASYSKNPQMKDGSLRALIYNDALHKGKQHLLNDAFNPNRIGKPEVPSSWKIEGKTQSQVIEPRGYNTPALSINEKYSLPDHQYPYFATPFLEGCRGGMINQKIKYEELLPTCAGKLNKLEWSHLTEEDRYTKRNFVIRTAQRTNADTNDLNGMNDFVEGHGGHGAWVYFKKLLVCVFGVAVFSGFPGTNSRSMNGVDPMNQSDTCKGESWVSQIPIFGSLLVDMIVSNAPAIPVLDGFHGQQTTKIQSVPMWAETSRDVRSLSGSERATLTSSSACHVRDSQNVPHVPKQEWMQNNSLYYDDAEGPDRIGNYNVHPWKTGTADSYQNAKTSGDTVDGYNPMQNGAGDPMG